MHADLKEAEGEHVCDFMAASMLQTWTARLSNLTGASHADIKKRGIL
jgi:hypothetical protein